jgi:hypothetical protein
MFQSQISINYSIVLKTTDAYQLKINIKNNTDSYYAIPLDIKGFKGYYESEYCGTFDDEEYPYRFFAPTVMLKVENTVDYLFPSSARGHIPEGEGAEKYITDLQKIANKELKEIREWKKKNHFKSNKDALQNRYITKNLLLLKPYEKFSYEIPLNLGNISRTNTSVLYDYYSLGFAKYDLSLHLCITENSYNWLTKQQKEKIKKYKLFTGVIKSNSHIFKAYE